MTATMNLQRTIKPTITPFELNSLLAFGDSTTAPRGSIQVYLDCVAQDLSENGMEIEAINAGIGGNTTEDARARFAKDVLERQADIVVIQFGINDAAVDVWKTPPATQSRVTISRFKTNLECFVAALRAQKSTVILMTPNATRWTASLKQMYGKPPYRPDDPDGFNVILQTYVDVVRAVSIEQAVPLVDVYAEYQIYGRNPGQSADDLLLDGMHPNDQGHRLVADLLIEEILQACRCATSPANASLLALAAPVPAGLVGC